MPVPTPQLVAGKTLVSGFATPIAAYFWAQSEALNAELKRLVLELEATTPSQSRSNVGGWHSADGLVHAENPAMNELRDRMRALTNAMTMAARRNLPPTDVGFHINGWANIVRNGHYHAVHNHPGCLWSGVYYVSVGKPANDDPANGRLEFLEPRLGIDMADIHRILIQPPMLITPKPGLMVMFPSWLNHQVHPFFGEGERISIAFNIRTDLTKKAS
jgi:uncharacterized protein (TIGR02466 family)